MSKNYKFETLALHVGQSVDKDTLSLGVYRFIEQVHIYLRIQNMLQIFLQ